MVDIVTTLQSLNTRSQDPTAVFSGTNINPATAIGQALQDQQTKYLQFPSDLPPHRFVIMQGKVTGAPTATGVFGGQYNYSGGTVYALPLPTTIQDSKSVKYDHNFNWMSMIASAGSAAGKLFGGKIGQDIVNNIAGYAGKAAEVGRGLGYAVNNFKAVTIAVPEFRTFNLEFRLFPKSQAESVAIQQMIVSIQRGMHPPYSTVLAAVPVFVFPDIFMCMFQTGQSGEDGSAYLYKFKPAVINGIQVNYMGDAPVPAFYKNNDGQAIPEGIVVRMNFIELEVWTQQNFDNSIDQSTGLYNTDPFSAVHK